MLLRARLLIAVTLACAGCASHAASGSGTERPSYTLSKKFGDMMQKVGKLAADKKWKEVVDEIDRVAEHKNLNPYERATLWAARAGANFQLNNNDEMLSDLQKAVALDAMPEVDQLATEYNLGQAYLTSERYSDAADTFGKWAQHAKEIKPSEYYVMASTYASAKRYQEALPLAQKAVDGMGNEPKEPWLQLLVSLHFELHQEAEVAKTLEVMVKSFPKTEHYLQLAASYQALKQNDKAVATLEQAGQKGLLTDEKDIVSLARLYANAGQGAKGAALLDQQMKAGKVKKTPENFEVVAIGYLDAKEPDKAEAAFAQAGADAGTGDQLLELGRLQAQRGQWLKARDTLVKAVQKGPKHSGDAHLLLGIVHYNTKRKDAALASLGEAKKHAESAKCADEWLQRVKSGKAATDLGCAAGAEAKH